MAGDEPRDGIVFAAGADPDQHRYSLAAIEVGDFIGGRRCRREP
jgi:hypothetical protein